MFVAANSNQRADDQPGTVRNRLSVYFEQTMPLVEFYKDKGLLREIDGQRDIEKVRAALLETIQAG